VVDVGLVLMDPVALALALVVAPAAVVEADVALPPCICSRKACSSLASCANGSVLPVTALLPVATVEVADDAFAEVDAPAETLVEALLANRLGWVMLEIDT
jgi:hypothetical protein